MVRGAWFAKLNVTKQMGTHTQWCQNKETDQLDSIENGEIESHVYVQLILGKDTKEIQWKKGYSFNKWNKTIVYPYAKIKIN